MVAAALVGPVLTIGIAQAATVNQGNLKLTNKKADAGTQGVAMGWTYRAQKPTAPGTRHDHHHRASRFLRSADVRPGGAGLSERDLGVRAVPGGRDHRPA